MTQQPADWRDGLPPKVIDEIQYIIDAFAELRQRASNGDDGRVKSWSSTGISSAYCRSWTIGLNRSSG